MPLLGASAVFAFVLATTPPGFASLISVVSSTAPDPGAYAAGAAASLALLTLVVLGAVCAAADRVLYHLRH